MLSDASADEDGTAARARTATRPPADRAALRGDLRSRPARRHRGGGSHGVFAFLYAAWSRVLRTPSAVMPFMDDAGTYWMYLLSQAFGW